MTPTPSNPYIKVVKGDVAKLLLAAPAAIKLVKLSIEVDLVCPDEVSPERRDLYKALFEELRTEFWNITGKFFSPSSKPHFEPSCCRSFS